jgi:hypothetical protein
MHFQCQNHRLGCLKRVTRILKSAKYIISKEQAKSMSLMFSSNKKQKLYTPSAHVQKVPVALYYKP